MVFAQLVVLGFFPLDDELGLLPGNLTPRLQEALVRLSTHIPSFAKASAELAWFTGAIVHPDTARRQTIAAGELLLAHHSAQANQILHTHPAPPCAPDTLLFSVDGAFIPLVHAEWTEVRTLAVGVVQPAHPTPSGRVVQTTNLSYFSRRSDSTTFANLALVELHRRGIDAARRVGAVVDGAAWCQTFIDIHYPEAVRILDFAHASEYLSRIGQYIGPQGPLLDAQELVELRTLLKRDGPEAVLERLREVVGLVPGVTELKTQLAYLEARVSQMQYGAFREQGWPIGSGMVESANKLVVEDRLKGAGMHWAQASVNPLLALRNAVCNDRWSECWTVIEQAQRHRVVAKRRAQRVKRREGGISEPHQVTNPPVITQEVRGVRIEPLPNSPVITQEMPVVRIEPLPKQIHPWKRAWSIRRQRELANAV